MGSKLTYTVCTQFTQYISLRNKEKKKKQNKRTLICTTPLMLLNVSTVFFLFFLINYCGQPHTRCPLLATIRSISTSFFSQGDQGGCLSNSFFYLRASKELILKSWRIYFQNGGTKICCLYIRHAFIFLIHVYLYLFTYETIYTIIYIIIYIYLQVFLYFSMSSFNITDITDISYFSIVAYYFLPTAFFLLGWSLNLLHPRAKASSGSPIWIGQQDSIYFNCFLFLEFFF